MFDLAIAISVLLLLCGSAFAGRWLLKVLPETHRTQETKDFTRIVSGLLVTFTALVLSLLITTVNGDFKKTDNDLRAFASMIVLLDGELDAFGPATVHTRSLLRQYTASAIASTWPGETPPSGDYPKAAPDDTDIDALVLGDMLRQAETEIRHLQPPDAEAEKVQAACLTRMAALLDQRWSLISEAHSSITPAFFVMMLFWLSIVFLSFGMTAPPNMVAAVSILMVAVSVAGAIFVILERDGPLDGLLQVGSEPMRHALRHLDRLPETPARVGARVDPIGRAGSHPRESVEGEHERALIANRP